MLRASTCATQAIGSAPIRLKVRPTAERGVCAVDYSATRPGSYSLVVSERGAGPEAGSAIGELVLSPALVFGDGFVGWRNGAHEVEVSRWAELRLAHALPREARGDDVKVINLQGPGALAVEVEPLGADAGIALGLSRSGGPSAGDGVARLGGFAVRLMVNVSGLYKIQITVLGHPIASSPFTVVALAEAPPAARVRRRRESPRAVGRSSLPAQSALVAGVRGGRASSARRGARSTQDRALTPRSGR